MDQRILNEIEHGRKIVNFAGKVWGWETPAGRERWKRRVEMLVSNVTPEMKVLEVGCGIGYLTKSLQNKKATIVSIDISYDLIEVAKSNVGIGNITFLLQNASSLGLADNLFDIVIGSSVLHHLEVDKALAEFYRVLKKEGLLVFTEPNMMNPQIAVQKNISLFKKLAGDSPDEAAFFRWLLKKKLIKHGFRDIKLKTFDFLHPETPKGLVPFMKDIGDFAESIPLISEIAGSIYIEARK
ncbi:methyltransferase domain-containing protein [bacterium]|nr:methyltransferase domain-containing protein [bacterium]